MVNEFVWRDKNFFIHNTFPFPIRNIFARKIVEKHKACNFRNKAAYWVV